MSKWATIVIFYLVLGLSIAFYSPWIGVVWLLAGLMTWLGGWILAIRNGWRMRHLPENEWQPTHSIYAALPRSWRDWIFGEGKYASRFEKRP